jgi:hypothetical protein
VKNASEKGIRINMKVEGEPAAWLEEWKRRGLVTSYTDAVVQSLRTFNERIIEQDLKSEQLNNIKDRED